MFNSTTLEVAIGMAFIYLLLSFFCSAINEAIAAILSSRAKNLEAGIKSLFTEGYLSKNGQGPTPGMADKTFLDAIYNHGLIQSLYKSGSGTVADRKPGNLPSYIPAATFATTLIDLLFPGEPGTATGLPPNLASMIDQVNQLPESKAKEALLTLVKQANGDIDKTRLAFENWYNTGIDRAAGWYKRKTQLVLFIIGFILAMAINVDSIAAARTLWTSPALRAYTIDAAQKYATDHPIQTASNSTTPTPASTSVAPATAQQDLSDLQQFGLPIGWTPQASKNFFTWPTLPLALVGWFLTALAMTLGASFWFDSLSKIMTVRSTVKPKDPNQASN